MLNMKSILTQHNQPTNLFTETTQHFLSLERNSWK